MVIATWIMTGLSLVFSLLSLHYVLQSERAIKSIESIRAERELDMLRESWEQNVSAGLKTED